MEQYQPEPPPEPPRQQVSWAVRGTLIAVILAVAAYIGFYSDVFKYEPGLQEQRITESAQNVLARAIEAYRDGGGKLGNWTEKELLPALRVDETAGLVLARAPTGLLKSDAVLDGFQHPMQVKVAAGPPTSVLIVSGGPDGQIGTPDDIILRKVLPPPPASQPAKETSHEGGSIQRKPSPGREHLDTYPSRF